MVNERGMLSICVFDKVVLILKEPSAERLTILLLRFLRGRMAIAMKSIFGRLVLSCMLDEFAYENFCSYSRIDTHSCLVSHRLKPQK